MVNDKERLKILKWLSKAIITTNWFSGSVEAGVIVVEHENWIKMNENVLNRGIITCIIRLQICDLYPSLSCMHIKKNIFFGVQVFGHPYCSSNFKPGLTLKLATEKYIRFLQK